MTHEGMSLASHVAVYKQVRQQIAVEFGLDEDDAALLDTVEGETELTDCLTKLLREAKIAAAMAKGIGEHQKQLCERKARLEAKDRRIKAIVLNAMTDVGLMKLSAPDFSATRSRSRPGVVITADVSTIPDNMCRISREPDKAAIGERLRAGERLDYAELGNASETLTVRST